MSVTEICIRRPILAWMLMAATVIFGAVAATRIGVSQFPDVDHPVISVNLTWEGAAPEAMETGIVEIVEEALSQVQGIHTLASTARQGAATITLELDLKRDIDAAVQDVQTRLSQAQQRLPRDMDAPIVSKSNPDDNPIMWVALSGPFSPQVLADTARYSVKEKLQTISGVGEVMFGGAAERNVRIWIDANKLDSRDLTVSDVIGALQRQHVEIPAGFIEAEGREIGVRVMGEALDLQSLRRLVIREVKGFPVHLDDVALVEDGFEDVRRLSRVNGEPAQGLGIRKQRGSNAVAVARAVRNRVDEIRKNLPEGMEFGINFDSTIYVEESVEELEFELLLAVGLTALVCWLFLGSLSTALNVIMAIPMSLLGTVAVIYFLGFTLNTFTLLALALAVGIVVDDAIMVLENIHRHSDLGKSGFNAAREGTAEIKFAALAATMAVVAIFLPVVFMEGVIGYFFLEFGITFCVAVLLSYIEAITLAPARAAQLLAKLEAKRAHSGHAPPDPSAPSRFSIFERLYARLLRTGMAHSRLVLVGAIFILVGAWALFRALPSELVPQQDQGRLILRFQTELGSDLAETDAIVRQAEAIINKRPEIARNYTVVGGFNGSQLNGGMMFLTLKPRSQRPDAETITKGLRAALAIVPGLRLFVQDQSQRGFSTRRSYPVDLSVRGPNGDELVKLSETLRDRLTESGTVADLDSDYKLGMPEVQILPNRTRAGDMGVSIQDVATSINALVGGVRAGKFSTGGRRVDVRVRLLADQRARPEDVGRLRVRHSNGSLIPLSTVITQEERPALQAVTRIDRERAISVFGNVAAGHTQNEVLKIAQKLTADLPDGYRVVPGGASTLFADSMRSLLFALLLGIIVAYMVLAGQFNSLIHPLTVLTILPLSVAGALLALTLFGSTLNLFSMIGLLLLMGIVKKNSIILVDYANQVRSEAAALGVQMSAREAMQKAGPVRLRPIVMTATATIMAAVPAAFGWGPGAEIRTPMAVAVIGGMLLATGLSLLIVPAFYVTVSRRLKKSSISESDSSIT
ncbi:MAG: efflux RND transporter permease subunit [Deltaproteobacteria bacterium]|nr:efflux RND transporter permease subunit [Deltaproteobacteria bacterium]